MNVKTINPAQKFNLAKWVIIGVLVAVGVVASTHYAAQPLIFQLLGWLILAGVVLSIAYQTSQGRLAWRFLKEAQIELRKVIWPTRQETLQTTGVVILMVVVTALFLWGIDSILLWCVSLLTGAKG